MARGLISLCRVLALWVVVSPVAAQSVASDQIVVAARMIPARSVLTAADLALKAGTNPAALARAEHAIGLETRVALYPGRPVHAADLSPPARVERNQIVSLIFQKPGLLIRAEGRAMERGAVGDVIRVMNLSSRSTTSGHVLPDGAILVSP